MNFDFSEEQYSFRDSLRSFLADHHDSPTRATEPLDGAQSRHAWAGLAELGIFAALVPGDYEGLGLTFVDVCLVLEELGRHLAAPAIVDTMVATDAIMRFGSAKLKADLLPRIAKGQARIAIAVHEAAGGYGLRDMRTASVRLGGRVSLQGDKILVTDAVSADFLLVAGGVESGNPQLVLIDRQRAGIELRKQSTLDLTADYYEIALRDVLLEDESFLRAASADRPAQRLLDASALAAAAMMTGIAGNVLEKAVEYVKQRVQFGRPVGSFQAIKHRCADMAVAVDSSRSAVYFAAWALANEAPECARAVSIAKSYSGDMCRFVCNEGIQLHGGMGFTWELGLHRYLRRAKLLEYCYGDATYHRERVIAETLAELNGRR